MLTTIHSFCVQKNAPMAAQDPASFRPLTGSFTALLPAEGPRVWVRLTNLRQGARSQRFTTFVPNAGALTAANLSVSSKPLMEIFME
jgi:hypothetical protein